MRALQSSHICINPVITYSFRAAMHGRSREYNMGKKRPDRWMIVFFLRTAERKQNVSYRIHRQQSYVGERSAFLLGERLK